MGVLSLDDPRWSTLVHAYGPADDIPELLRQLASTPRENVSPNAEPWFSLWSALCHQGDVYTASYAVVPHIVETALSREGPLNFSFLSLPTAIEIARATGHGPALPDEYADAYLRSIYGLTDCVRRQMDNVWSRDFLLAANAALAIAKGQIDVAYAMQNIDDWWIAKINANETD